MAKTAEIIKWMYRNECYSPELVGSIQPVIEDIKRYRHNGKKKWNLTGDITINNPNEGPDIRQARRDKDRILLISFQVHSFERFTLVMGYLKKGIFYCCYWLFTVFAFRSELSYSRYHSQHSHQSVLDRALSIWTDLLFPSFSIWTC
jgi:hypothetical protein